MTTSKSTPPTEEMSSLTLQQPKGTAKRDSLLANEVEIQALWSSERAFEADPSDDDDERESFIVTFPYPYSNGHLHIGHAFSLTKAIFRAQFERHLGKNVLFPFAFHCTGMPIQAAANKLKAELEQYGFPPKFPEEDPKIRAEMEAAILSSKSKSNAPPDKKAKGNKTKLVSKTGTGIVRQYNILLKMISPPSEIPKFTDPHHWLRTFPPIGVSHLKNFGAGVDWRRAFITTAVNPYYDAFIRWQFETLRKKKKILFGKRNNVYSILDGQVCADHDRSEGEGVGPQEYVLIKLRVLDSEEEDGGRHDKMKALMKKCKEDGYKGVFLVPATLRPETMYGQTNCFVLPSGSYGAFVIDATNEVFIMSARSARGLSCQFYDSPNGEEGGRYYTNEFGKITQLETFSGDELLGLPLSAPNATYDKVYTLPLLTISMSKGTGVVTSVPSDAPDDHVALRTLKEKPDFASKYGITPSMVDPFDVVPIISIPGYGDASAVFMCDKLKIKSVNDKAKLTQAKDETYLKGFTLGVMTVGPHAGKKVSEAKPIIKNELIASGDALLYHEPESKVVSRTNDECVVASTDQWYLAYGEPSWRDAVKEHVLNSDLFEPYDETARDKYVYTIGWLKEWACTRQFGLGTYLPWDTKWVIESLSDSTIYMAYYTISHYLQGEDNLNGDIDQSPNKIDPKLLTTEVFDYIYLKNAPPPVNSGIPLPILQNMRSEFRYWYPMNLRVSAKDLIPNHLTMALYNHAAIWEDEPELWPRGYYTNGHVLVDAEKMSKSKGNFLMMDETVKKYSADATRFACADAGDSLDDANFSRETADAAIVSLCNEETWVKETLVDEGSAELRKDVDEADWNFMDRVLDNEVNRLIRLTAEAYGTMQFRDGLQHGWFEMLLVRNEYRSWCKDGGIAMNINLVRKWAESLVIAICPVCPHWSEKMWKLLGHSILAVKAPWPTNLPPEDKLLTRRSKFLRDSIKTFRAQVGKAKKGWKSCHILVTDSYPSWKVDTLLWMHEKYDATEGKFADDFMKELKKWTTSTIQKDKKLIKLTMQFASWMKKEVEDVGEVAMDVKLAFDQKEILMESERYLKAQLNLGEMGIVKLDDDDDAKELKIPDKIAQNVAPGRPYMWIR